MGLRVGVDLWARTAEGSATQKKVDRKGTKRKIPRFYKLLKFINEIMAELKYIPKSTFHLKVVSRRISFLTPHVWCNWYQHNQKQTSVKKQVSTALTITNVYLIWSVKVTRDFSLPQKKSTFFSQQLLNKLTKNAESNKIDSIVNPCLV